MYTLGVYVCGHWIDKSQHQPHTPTTVNGNTKQDKVWIKGNIISHFRRMYDAYFDDIKLLQPHEVG